jgi:hypothetical protein
VHRHDSVEALAAHVASSAFEAPNDGVVLLQQYIAPAQQRITRAEFVGGTFLYAVRVDASGGFQLCPADKCSLDEQRALRRASDERASHSAAGAFCPANASLSNKFVIAATPPPAALLAKYEALLAAHDVHVAGIEFLTDADGQHWTYDINTNTNYNRAAEYRHFGKKECNYGMMSVAEFLARQCWQLLNEQSDDAANNNTNNVHISARTPVVSQPINIQRQQVSTATTTTATSAILQQDPDCLLPRLSPVHLSMVAAQ